jgi:hypothetical protein
MSTDEFTEADNWGGRSIARKIVDAVPRGRVVVSGVVRTTRTNTAHGPLSFECTLDDGTGEIDLLFLGRRTVDGIVARSCVTVEGTARMEGGRLVVWNPLYRIEPSDD